MYRLEREPDDRKPHFPKGAEESDGLFVLNFSRSRDFRGGGVGKFVTGREATTKGDAEIQFNHSATMKINLPTSVLNHRLELAERRAKSGCIHHTWLRVARVLRLKLTLLGQA